jgi:hypothetical protein
VRACVREEECVRLAFVQVGAPDAASVPVEL